MSLRSHQALRRRIAAAGTLGVLVLASVAATAPGSAAGAGETEATNSFSAPCVLAPGVLNYQDTFDITTRAQQPAGVETGADFSFEGASITFNGPAELSEGFQDIGVASVKGTVTSFPGVVTNALPASLNLADSATFSSGLPFQATVTSGQKLAFTAPSEARTTAWGPLTVTGERGQDVRLALATATGFRETEPEEFKATGEGIIASISGYNAEGTKVIGPLQLVCSAPSPTTLAEAPIGRGEPPPPPAEAPGITSITPEYGPAAGGTTVTITGSGFTNVASVEFEGANSPSFTVLSPEEITAVTPAGDQRGEPSDEAEVRVITPSSTTSSQGGHFFYQGLCAPPGLNTRPYVTGVTPVQGPESGGTIVTLGGQNLGGVTSVEFGSKIVPVTGTEAGRPIAVTPPGSGTVTVSVPGGCWPGVTAEFIYLPPSESFPFKGWTLAGSLTPKPLGQAITLPSGSAFNGSGELNTKTSEGTVSGSVSVPAFRATPKLFGFIPATLGMTVTQSGAISGTIAPSKTVPGDETLTLPVKLNLGFTSIGLLGLNVPTKCTTSQPVSLTLTDTLTREALLSKGWSFSGTTTIPKITCEGGLLGALYGETVSGLVAGAGAGYSLTFTAPGS